MAMRLIVAWSNGCVSAAWCGLRLWVGMCYGDEALCGLRQRVFVGWSLGAVLLWGYISACCGCGNGAGVGLGLIVRFCCRTAFGLGVCVWTLDVRFCCVVWLRFLEAGGRDDGAKVGVCRIVSFGPGSDGSISAWGVRFFVAGGYGDGANVGLCLYVRFALVGAFRLGGCISAWWVRFCSVGAFEARGWGSGDGAKVSYAEVVVSALSLLGAFLLGVCVSFGVCVSVLSVCVWHAGGRAMGLMLA
ncbi:hypothetical protein EDC01DRAFT_632885 [Geopyxis carbonaria]|nr:hypothetical protein EDC01DRAFT_632885 [Geopyxis carbonaria]